MRSRRRQGPAVSLFAFQDVMASVIGILFLLVLIMALSVVDEKMAEGKDSPIVDESELANLREAVKTKRLAVETLENEVGSLARRVEFVSAGDPQAARKHVEGLRRELTKLYTEIERKQTSLEKLAKRSRPKEQDLLSKTSELKRTKLRLAKLKKLVGAGASRPKVTYIVDEQGDSKEPWLVEIDSDQIRVGSKDGRSATLRFGAQPFDVRKKQFLAWAGTQDKRSHYFVLLIKPSGLKNANDIGQGLVDEPLKFEIGTDLLPETWVAFE